MRIQYKFTGRKKDQFRTDYSFRVTGQEGREIWMVLENSRHAKEKRNSLFMQEIVPVPANNTARFSFELYTLAGNVDLDSIQFQPLQVEQINPKTHELNCYVEKQVKHWSTSNGALELDISPSRNSSLPPKEHVKLSFNMFEPFLTLIDQHYFGLDTRVARCRYKARKLGIVSLTFLYLDWLVRTGGEIARDLGTPHCGPAKKRKKHHECQEERSLLRKRAPL